MATAIERGFELVCPSCHELTTVLLDLTDLDRCKCESCDDEFTVETAVQSAKDQLAKWEALARWIEAAPAK